MTTWKKKGTPTTNPEKVRYMKRKSRKIPIYVIFKFYFTPLDVVKVWCDQYETTLTYFISVFVYSYVSMSLCGFSCMSLLFLFVCVPFRWNKVCEPQSMKQRRKNSSSRGISVLFYSLTKPSNAISMTLLDGLMRWGRSRFHFFY